MKQLKKLTLNEMQDYTVIKQQDQMEIKGGTAPGPWIPILLPIIYDAIKTLVTSGNSDGSGGVIVDGGEGDDVIITGDGNTFNMIDGGNSNNQTTIIFEADSLKLPDGTVIYGGSGTINY